MTCCLEKTERRGEAKSYRCGRIYHETRARRNSDAVSLLRDMCIFLELHDNPRYFGKIQDKDEDYYMQFNLIICGLDSVEARRWINATLVNMVDPENQESLKPLIDGGTEGKYRVAKSRLLNFESYRF
jgi:molybdopterin/thiamine biosynthesis adenylyltransferase